VDSPAQRLDPESLLAHASWARRLAASLVGDGEADDLVQEAWRIALERPPNARTPASLRAWLGRVLAHLGYSARRERSTRAWHEDRAARREASEAHAAEVAEMQKRLADAVCVLDEPYRSAIVLRYFDGLDSSAIAERVGISAVAARQRVSRGLAMLRERLDRESRGGREAWSAVCLTWTAAERTSSATALATGGAIVGAKLAALAAAVILLVTCVWWWSRPDATTAQQHAGSGEAPAAIATGVARDATASVAALDSKAERAELVVAAPAPGERAIDRERDLHGVIVDVAGAPIEGAELVVLRVEASEYVGLDAFEASRAVEVASERSDARGEFAIALPPGRAFDLAVTAGGYAAQRLAHLHAGERVVVVLAPGGSVFGRVTRRSDGSPVARARVLLPMRPEPEIHVGVPALATVTDALGRFRFDDLAAASYWLQVEPERDAPPFWIAVKLLPAETREVNVTVDAGVTLNGRVVDAETGAGIAGAFVGEGWMARRSVETDASGAFVFESFAESGFYELVVRADGYGQRNVKVRDPDGPFPAALEVRLERARAAHGRLVDESGAPIGDGYVAAPAYDIADDGAFGTQQQDWPATRSATDGSFRLTSLRPDLPHALLVRLDGFATATYAFPPNEREVADVDFGDVVLRRGALVRGRVVDEHGEGVAAIAVRLAGANGDQGRWGGKLSPALAGFLSERSTRSDDLGRFAFDAVAAGTYALGAIPLGTHDRPTTTLEVSEGVEPAPLTIVVPRGLSIAGRVVDRDGVPLAASVSFDPEDDDVTTNADVETHGDGSYAAGGLAAGSYTLSVYPHSLWSDDPTAPHWTRARLEHVAAGASDVEIVLGRAIQFRGRVVDSSGAPLANVEVVVRRNADDPFRDSMITQADGRFGFWVAEGERFELDATANAAAEPVDPAAIGRTVHRSGLLADGAELELVIP
jgi:RNA polymerase sigma-70 factor (ECF subfamily)